MDMARGNRRSVSGLGGNLCRNGIGYRNRALVSTVDTQRPYVKWTFIVTTDTFHRERTLEFNVAIRHVTHFCMYTSVRTRRPPPPVIDPLPCDLNRLTRQSERPSINFHFYFNSFRFFKY